MVLAHRGVAAQRDRRPAQLAHGDRRGDGRLHLRQPDVSRFVGHAVCDSPEWLNGLSSPITDSYHPNVAGHRDGYAVVTKPAFGLATTLTAAAATTRAERSAATLTRDARRYAAADAAIAPERVVAPDLTTPAARAAAARAGVDLASRSSIDAADRRADARQLAARR